MHEPELSPRQAIHSRASHLLTCDDRITVIMIAIIVGTAGYLLGRQSIIPPNPCPPEKLTTYPTAAIRPVAFQPTQPAEPLAKTTPALCPPALPEGDPSQAYTWKSYTCPAVGVSFLYPANLLPGPSGFVVYGRENFVQIDHGPAYIFRITKLTTTSEVSMWPLPTGAHIRTSFHGYPAYLQQATAMTAGQVAENVYTVQISPAVIYTIEYQVPDPRYSTDPAYIENEHMRDLLTSGMQKILDSVVFHIDQK